MNLAQLQAAAALLNLAALSRAAGLSESYLRSYVANGRELPADVQARIDEALARVGLARRS